jgi:hypothetical protein
MHRSYVYDPELSGLPVEEIENNRVFMYGPNKLAPMKIYTIHKGQLYSLDGNPTGLFLNFVSKVLRWRGSVMM